MNNYRRYAIWLGCLFVVFVLVEYYRPKPINWNQTFSNKDKIPYGTYVLYNLLPDIFRNQLIESVRQPVANRLQDNGLAKSNYVFVNGSFWVDSLDLISLLDYVHAGNQVFISAENYADILKDTLHFDIAMTQNTQRDSLGLLFTHPQLKNQKPIKYAWQNVNMHFELKPQKGQVTLGKNTAGNVNFLQIPFGKGVFYLSTVPLAFCNYHVISTAQNKYAAIALSHLPVQPVLWDEYQKQGRLDDESVFRVLVSHEPLRWAYYIALFSLVLFVVFESKRTQRIIPVLEKPRNTTLEFIQVVGNLYFNYKNHKIIADKKINYFLEFLRLHYYQSTSVLDEELQAKISLKAGIDLKDMAALFTLINQIKSESEITEQQLWQLNKQLEDFYRQSGR